MTRQYTLLTNEREASAVRLRSSPGHGNWTRLLWPAAAITDAVARRTGLVPRTAHGSGHPLGRLVPISRNDNAVRSAADKRNRRAFPVKLPGPFQFRTTGPPARLLAVDRWTTIQCASTQPRAVGQKPTPVSQPAPKASNRLSFLPRFMFSCAPPTASSLPLTFRHRRPVVPPRHCAHVRQSRRHHQRVLDRPQLGVARLRADVNSFAAQRKPSTSIRLKVWRSTCAQRT